MHQSNTVVELKFMQCYMSNLFSKKLRYDSHKTYSFKVCNLVGFSILTNLYSSQHYKFQNIFITPSILEIGLGHQQAG